MKKLFILIIISSLSISLFAQTFEKYWHKADSLYRIGEYKKACNKFENALKIKETDADGYLYIAGTWALVGDTLKTLKYLNLVAEKGWYKRKLLENIPDFTFLHNLKAWKEIISIVQQNLNEYEQGFDIILKRKLEKIRIKDQFLRNLSEDVEKKYKINSEEFKYYIELMQQQDSINLNSIKNIIEKYGWPGISLVGKEANITVWLVIQHASLNTQEYYLPYLKESVIKGESRGQDLAYLEDRILMSKGKPQKYGSQLIRDSKTGEFIFYKIEDPDNVNKRRAEVGLQPIEEYMKKYNIKWNTEDIK